MMGVERIGLFADALLAGGRPADTPVAVVQDGTTRIQKTVRTTLAELPRTVAEQSIRPPSVWVVGQVVALC